MDTPQCFKVYYTKQLNRKKKVYQEGVLVCHSNSAKLFDQEGQCLLKFKNKTRPVVDEQYTINHTYLILIDQPVEHSKFESGKIFMNEDLPIKKNVIPKSKNIKDTIKLQCGIHIEQELFNVLMKHQVEGVCFMYECLTGKRKNDLTGCILADHMGLGKTLQTLTVCFCMLRQSLLNKFIVVCPLTLLSVWENETKKWLDKKLNPLICYGNINQVSKIVKTFVQTEYRMMIISYESFYRSMDKLSGKIDMIIFDEGHRLKNKKTKLLIKLKSFRCERRIVLSGTPIQNNLEELFACLSIVYPKMFQNQTLFRNIFSKPILDGMNPHASKDQQKLARERTKQLSNQLKQFSLRRTADVLEAYLPKRQQHLVFFKLTNLQKLWYERIVSLKNNSTDVLVALNQLRKLFTHPSILKLEKINRQEGLDCKEECQNQQSYKVQFVLDRIRYCRSIKEKIVIVSYYTQTLDFIASSLKQSEINYARLDGRLKISDRKKAILEFQTSKDILLLSGKAGGTGLTLTCATHMVMVQPDWNPSNDSQVMGRIWRHGQKKPVHIYRLLIGSSVEQKVLQRQKLKKNLSDKLIDQSQNKQYYDLSQLSNLFIKNQERVLTYPQQENSMKSFMDQHHAQFQEGIIFVKTIDSSIETSTNVNQFQRIDFDQIGLDDSEPEDDTASQEDEWRKPLKIQKKVKKEKIVLEESSISQTKMNGQRPEIISRKKNGKIEEFDEKPLAWKKIKKREE